MTFWRSTIPNARSQKSLYTSYKDLSSIGRSWFTLLLLELS